jgi:hypothetical protein
LKKEPPTFAWGQRSLDQENEENKDTRSSGNQGAEGRDIGI